jgi:anaerobic dimethyl sulfoxide reductase subunit B (iron-sulfur subunit)
MLKQMAFHVDTSACVNCRACQIVCKDKNDLPVGVTWRRVIQYGGGTWVAKG